MSRSSTNRDLALLRKSASSMRVLNLLVAQERIGETAEYRDRPLFYNRRLNQSLIIKHALRDVERHYFEDVHPIATKVILPFSFENLSLGGISFFVDQLEFSRTLRDALGDYVSAEELRLDIDVLRALDRLPSLDPFLVRATLFRMGRMPARGYFDISHADVKQMHPFVTKEMGRLIALAFRGRKRPGPELSRHLALSILSSDRSDALEPLRQTLQLSVESLFAWKGYLYYKWALSDLAPKIASVTNEIANAIVTHGSREVEEEINNSMLRIVATTNRTLDAVRSAISVYDDAFAALTEGRSEVFRICLANAPATFLEIGAALGAIAHVTSYWRFRRPAGRDVRLEASEALELFQYLEQGLADEIDEFDVGAIG